MVKPLIDILEFGVGGFAVGPETGNRVSYVPSVSVIERTQCNLSRTNFFKIYFSIQKYINQPFEATSFAWMRR